MTRFHMDAHLPADEIDRRYKACRDAREKTRWQIIWLLTRADGPRTRNWRMGWSSEYQLRTSVACETLACPLSGTGKRVAQSGRSVKQEPTEVTAQITA